MNLAIAITNNIASYVATQRVCIIRRPSFIMNLWYKLTRQHNDMMYAYIIIHPCNTVKLGDICVQISSIFPEAKITTSPLTVLYL